MRTELIMVKLDISNALSSLHRDSMLSSVDEILPEMAAYCHLAYAEATSLQFGKFTVARRFATGRPLGTSTLLPTATDPDPTPLAFGYLDDITLGGYSEVVEA